MHLTYFNGGRLLSAWRKRNGPKAIRVRAGMLSRVGHLRGTLIWMFLGAALAHGQDIPSTLFPPAENVLASLPSFSSQERVEADQMEPPSPPPEILMERPDPASLTTVGDWLTKMQIGYDDGFVFASDKPQDDLGKGSPYFMRISGWGQLRHTILDSAGPNPDVNQFQLKRARLIFSGSAFTPAFYYFFQGDGRSSSGDDFRLLDYYLSYDFGRDALGLRAHAMGIKTGKYKVPFTLARAISGKEFELSDRSVASMYFDVNRSLASSLYGTNTDWWTPIHWEVALFNGLVTGGAETGSSGTLDNNFAYSGRLFAYPVGEWGPGHLADLSCHRRLATRVGIGFANSTIEDTGVTEFERVRVVDSGERLSEILPSDPVGRSLVSEYTVSLFSMDFSAKYQGWSLTSELYGRTIDDFQGAYVPSLQDYGFWLQLGKFIIPRKLQLISRWSRVWGDSGTLGEQKQSSDEVAGAFVWYFRDQHAKFTLDVTHLDGAPISSDSLGIQPGDMGWLVRTQMQFAF